MGIKVEIQNMSVNDNVPGNNQFRLWVEAALEKEKDPGELTIRIVNEDEGAALNRDYRGKNGATNVLSFAYENPPGVNANILGDLVICAPVIEREAFEQDKPLSAHWAHMVIHGVMHLRGFDHIEEDQAAQMEARETEILTGLGFNRPYE